MDPLDIKFATVKSQPWNNFLGIDLSPVKKLLKGKTVAEQYHDDLVKRYPFSDICADQSERIAMIEIEADLVHRATYREQVGSQAYNDLNDKLTVIIAFLKTAQDHANAISCPAPVDPVLNTTNVVLTATQSPAPSVTSLPKGQLIKGVDNRIVKYAVIALIGLAVLKIIK